MGAKTDWANLLEETLEDRRKGKRVKLRYELEVVGADWEGKPYTMQASTLDVSEMGCSFEIARTLSPGEDVSLRVKRKDETGTQTSTGALVFHVMWVKKEKDLYVVGAEMVGHGNPWKIAFPPKIIRTRLS
jgi:hypothetical protein